MQIDEIIHSLQLLHIRWTLWHYRSPDVLYCCSTSDYVEVVLYGVRLAGCLFLFFVGIKAPGIASVEDYIPYQRDAASAGTNNVSHPDTTDTSYTDPAI